MYRRIDDGLRWKIIIVVRIGKCDRFGKGVGGLDMVIFQSYGGCWNPLGQMLLAVQPISLCMLVQQAPPPDVIHTKHRSTQNITGSMVHQLQFIFATFI